MDSSRRTQEATRESGWWKTREPATAVKEIGEDQTEKEISEYQTKKEISWDQSCKGNPNQKSESKPMKNKKSESKPVEKVVPRKIKIQARAESHAVKNQNPSPWR